MCGISGIINCNNKLNIQSSLLMMNNIQCHRGPDDTSIWINNDNTIGFGHVRLSIIDLNTGQQPLKNDIGNVIILNGEIYNYLDLKIELSNKYNFKTNSDTEVVLAAYQIWGENCINHFRGMFSFVIWDEVNKKVFCVRDRFGIKPFYYFIDNDNIFYFSSEVKALLPFAKKEIDIESLNDYFTYQFMIGNNTLFKNIKQLNPAHYIIIENNKINIKKYWEIQYNIDYNHTKQYFQNKLIDLLYDTIKYHLISDVEIGSYLSGGIDSSLISILAGKYSKNKFQTFNGRFNQLEYDESKYAKIICNQNNFQLNDIQITSQDFINNINNIIYHLDYPVAGPGSFPQYMVSQYASKYLKVVLGGQGGDEIFGGYARYLIAYFEQCIKGAIDGTSQQGNYIVTYESIIPNLVSLKAYKPMMKEFWSNGLFDDKDKRYYSLINKFNTFNNEINIDIFKDYNSFDKFKDIFWQDNVGNESYFNNMTNFDFKTLLPALLHVEDRMSMAHGIESRVPFLDHKLIEFVATIPSNIKFENGNLKFLLKDTFKNILPIQISNRKDKMGFPVPLNLWAKNELKEFIFDIFKSEKAKHRIYMNSNFDIEHYLNNSNAYNRNLWALLSLELWQQIFIDK